MAAMGFDPVVAFNMLLERLDRIAESLDRMATTMEKSTDIQEQKLSRK